MTDSNAPDILDETPDPSDLWEGIGGHFDSLTQVLAEFVDNAAANFSRPDVTVRQVLLTFEELGEDLVRVAVEDTGTGIEDLRVAFRLGDTSKQDSPLSAHGFGLKHALATANRGNDAWRVRTRTAEDFAAGGFRDVGAPYSFQLPVYRRPAGEWPGVTNGTGTHIEFHTSRRLFDSISKGTPGAPGFDLTLDYLAEDLGFIYADIIKAGGLLISIQSGGQNRPVPAVEPEWEGTYQQGEGSVSQVIDGHAIQIGYKFGAIREGRWRRHYRRQQKSAGVEFRLNGRVIDWGVFAEVWGLEKHPSYNHLLVKINLTAADKGDMPLTRTSKNGFHEGDPILLGVIDWIRGMMPSPPKELTSGVGEHELVLQLAKAYESLYDGNPIAVETEFAVYKDAENCPRADLYFFDGGSRKVYEAKKNRADVKDLYQLVMYWDGMVFDGNRPSEGILVASEFASGVDDVIEVFNARTDADGLPYSFKKKTWHELTVNYPPD